jgi:hypothetical protein
MSLTSMQPAWSGGSRRTVLRAPAALPRPGGVPDEGALVFGAEHGQPWSANAFEKARQRRFVKLAAVAGDTSPTA